MKFLSVWAAALMGVFALTGCGTTQAVKAKPLKPVYGEGVELAKFDTVTVKPFEVTSAKAEDTSAGTAFANAIARRLEYDFGNLFQTVRVGQPQGDANEAVVTGRITKYEPGSRAARLLGPGIGKAELEGELVVKDATTDQPLVIAPIDKLWAWGHSVGAAKGMENMMEESAAAAANMIARAKGWSPREQASLGP